MKKILVISMIIAASLASIGSTSASVYGDDLYSPKNPVGQSGAFSDY